MKTTVYKSKSKKLTDGLRIALVSDLHGRNAEKAIKAGISEVVFDRGGYIYHGRVKALADAAREAGLKF